MTIAFIVIAAFKIEGPRSPRSPGGPWQAVVGALVMLMAGFGLGWINIAADWSRYQRRDSSGARSSPGTPRRSGSRRCCSSLRGSLARVGRRRRSIVSDPIGALAQVLPTWFPVPSSSPRSSLLVSGARSRHLYPSGLTCSPSASIPAPPRPLVDGVIPTAGTIWSSSPQNFLGPFQSFLITLGVPSRRAGS